MSNIFFDKIREYAKKLELNINEDGERLCTIDFDMGEGRSQRVIVLHHPAEDHGGFVEISSAVLDMDSLPDKQLGLEMATKLLKENDNSLGANWAIDRQESSTHLIATGRWFLDDMDLEEFELSVYNAASMADGLESTLGVDNF